MKQILIVEDQAEIRELVRISLEFEDYDIQEAENGVVGWDKLRTLQPDLILLDLMMPGGVDGLELCRRVRADPRLKRTKVIMLTALATDADRSAGLAAGANGYLAKPFSPLELMKTIAGALG